MYAPPAVEEPLDDEERAQDWWDMMSSEARIDIWRQITQEPFPNLEPHKPTLLGAATEGQEK